MRNKLYVAMLSMHFALIGVQAKGVPPMELTPQWEGKIAKLAPATPRVKPESKRTVLLFSRFTGFNHWVIPHTDAVIKTLGKKSGAFEVVQSNELDMFSKEKLRQFDAVILNNNCSKGPGRNLFLDILGKGKEEEAALLEGNLIDFVAEGGGLVAIHGAIVIFNNSERFSDLLGGSFDFHPAQQEVTINLVEPEHPLVKAFEGKPFVHVDEPYLFNKAYAKKNFRPLLVMDAEKLNCGSAQQKAESDVRYVSWIKKHGQGRVFYVSPSHNAQSFEDPRLLKFLLDGIQYTLGDLKCDDAPRKP